MHQDDIDYIIELLDDAMAENDWDIVKEAQQYILDFMAKKQKTKFVDDINEMS